MSKMLGSQYSVAIERPETNSFNHFKAVPCVPSPSDPTKSVEVPPNGSEGIYIATFVITTAGQIFHTELPIEKLLESGHSLLLMPPTLRLKLELKDENGTSYAAIFIPNQNGEVAKAQVEFSAMNVVDAETKAYDIVSPMISWLSYRYDVAVEISGYEIKEKSTGLSVSMFGLMGKAKPLQADLSESLHVSRPEYRTFFGAYREGLTSSNPFYQFLCYYKVIEGIGNLRIRRQRAEKVPKEQQFRILPHECIPAKVEELKGVDDFDCSIFVPYLGQNFGVIIEETAETMRDAIAHMNPYKSILRIDSAQDISSCRGKIPLIKFMAREMLRNFLSEDPNFTNAKIS